MTATAAAGSKRLDRPRGPLRLMLDPTFGTIFWGKLLVSAGVWMHSMVAAIVVFNVTGSAFLVGLVSVCQFVPQLLFTPVSGKWADRGHAIRLVYIGRLLCIAGSGSVALFVWLRPDSDPTAAVMVASVAVGLGFVAGGPALQAMVPKLIRPGELPAAMALNTVPMAAARIAGPVLGAVFAAHLGPAIAFTASTATHCVFGLLLLWTKLPAPVPRHAETDYSVRAAVRFVRRDRALFTALLAIGAVGFGSEPSLTLAPAMAHELGGGPWLVGELSTGFGVGAGLGMVAIYAVIRWLASSTIATTGLWLLAVGLVCAGVGPSVPAVLLALAVAGLGFSWAVIGLSTVVQERAPDSLRGRIMGLWMVGFVGSRPAAAAMTGATADLLTVRWAFVLCATLLAITAILCRPRYLLSPELQPISP